MRISKDIPIGDFNTMTTKSSKLYFPVMPCFKLCRIIEKHSEALV